MELKRIWSGLASGIIGLLIVPYGIETKNGGIGAPYFKPFNRTLWN